jgi:hypothetical protein
MKIALKKIYWFALVMMIIASCAKQPSSSRYKGKIKRGKPVPCPVKDC